MCILTLITMGRNSVEGGRCIASGGSSFSLSTNMSMTTNTEKEGRGGTEVGESVGPEVGA
jgi:hypothetical protein